MEPRQFHPEQAPAPSSNVELSGAGEFSLPNLERPLSNDQEQKQSHPEVSELNRQVSSTAGVSLPQPIINTPAPVADPDAGGDSPIVAADEDLIEKEWVDKAKQIISSTKDDPYRREQEIKRLQLDYVRKRYGKEIGAKDV